jgi:hypothetical protein
VFLFLHPFLFPGHLLELFLFSQSLEHSDSKLFFEVFFLLFLFLFHLSLL